MICHAERLPDVPTWLGKVRLDVRGRRLITETGNVRLTPREADVLALLPLGQAVRKEDVRHALWRHLADPPEDKSLDVTMCRLRQKLAPLGMRIESTGWGAICLITSDPAAMCPMCGHPISDPTGRATDLPSRPTPSVKERPR